ncbi:methylcrotonoyl-coenzyme A carboxylase 2 isoform X1 [Polypterus senegalus]|uniref:methylcrotonoyl-coenzyme A carboxylase 2 isoform X1 n=2 Tax=Polypterus senegalus TaxID=55291 RepID=UPI001962F555|nr:methylcrotonoyl-coenzyme A carboxylase 2 isoform X1 [Polypterus senegalus]
MGMLSASSCGCPSLPQILWLKALKECRKIQDLFSASPKLSCNRLRLKLAQNVPRRYLHLSKPLPSGFSPRLDAFPLIKESLHPVHRHVYEVNFRNNVLCHQRYREYMENVQRGGGENAILRHTERNKKLLVRERLRLLFDDEDYLELSPLAGLNLPYGDIPRAGCFTGIGKIHGLWCMVVANDATVKGGTAFPITVKKQLRCQEIAIQNHLPCVYVVDSGGAFLPLQAEIFPDKNQGGRTFYNEAIMSAMKIPQVAIVCGSCTAGGAYIPTMAEESVIVDKIGTIFLGGPPLVKAATGEDVSPEDLGGARVHSEISGCVDHFASNEHEAFQNARNVIATLNFELPSEITSEVQEPLYNSKELLGLAPRDYAHTLDVRLILSHLTDGSRFQEFKELYGTTLVAGFASIVGNLVGIIAGNGQLTYEAALKACHFVQICDQRGVPLIFLQNSPPFPALTSSVSQAALNSNRLKAHASLMSAVASASVPKITIVIGGCYGAESYALCGRSFDPNFFFLWPNARVALVGPNDHLEGELQNTAEDTKVKQKLEEESSAFYSSSRLWDDGVILPQDTRKVLGKCLKIIKQQNYQLVKNNLRRPVFRM